MHSTPSTSPPTGLQSLVDTGTRLWLDSVDPEEVARFKKLGATGATSNPIIISDLIASGRFDEKLNELFDQHESDEAVAWAMTDHLVGEAQKQFADVWESSEHNDGWVSFELDPLLEEVDNPMPHADKVARYIKLAKQWSDEQTNRMIKVPATPAGLDALEEIAAMGTTINVTLVFSERQYQAARDAIWRGRQRYGQLDMFKSVYSIFISRVDVYTAKHVDNLSDHAQGMVGLVNAKRLWEQNRDFWGDQNLKLDQEIIFASTGKKLDWQEPDYYVDNTAGDGIQTNPPETNAAVEEMGKTYEAKVDQMPPRAVLDEIDEKVDVQAMEEQLMHEGLKKFSDPMNKLLGRIRESREELKSA